jgi:hypothetical protein
MRGFSTPKLNAESYARTLIGWGTVFFPAHCRHPATSAQAPMHFGNALAARVYAQKRKHRVHHTASSPHEHVKSKRARHPQVLQVSLAYRGRMLRE